MGPSICVINPSLYSCSALLGWLCDDVYISGGEDQIRVGLFDSFKNTNLKLSTTTSHAQVEKLDLSIWCPVFLYDCLEYLDDFCIATVGRTAGREETHCEEEVVQMQLHHRTTWTLLLLLVCGPSSNHVIYNDMFLNPYLRGRNLKFILAEPYRVGPHAMLQYDRLGYLGTT
jgi:hypothetical protein